MIKPIVEVTASEGAADMVIDLTTVFQDPDIPNTPGHKLTYIARYNSNLSLVRATVVGSILTLDFQDGQIGDADIIVRATDNGFPNLYVEDRFWVHVIENNDPPTISDIANVSTPEDTPKTGIAFTVADPDTPVGALTVTATSSNQTLIPNGNLVVTGTGAARTLSVSPALNQTGLATISLVVSDGEFNATKTFQITVTPVNDAPTVAQIGSQTTAEDTTLGPISILVGDVDSPLDSLIVTAVSSNQTVIPNSGIVLGGSGANRTITITPAANQFTVTPVNITVTVQRWHGSHRDHVVWRDRNRGQRQADHLPDWGPADRREYARRSDLVHHRRSRNGCRLADRHGFIE